MSGLSNKQQPRAVIVMGVSGSGKTTTGRALAAALGWPFYDADDYHPADNVAKMAAGRPLTDADRSPWLEALHRLIAGRPAENQSLVLACSALKKAYRDQLRAGNEGVVFVYLHGDYELIAGRMQAREAHFMPADLLRSQFAALEEPEHALVVAADRPVAEIVQTILHTYFPKNSTIAG